MLIGEIKKFAVDSLGLKNTDNYTTFYDQQNKPVLWVLTASEPFTLKAYQWYFPMLGNVAYKGFFLQQKGIKEMDVLKKKCYDVDLSPTGGWSTLGWFKDPVLSNMLYNSKGALAELIIHELTHGTLYVKNNVDFNENLASFVGEKGAEKFLLMKFGKHSEEITNYKSNLADEKVFEKYLFNSTQQLKILYQSISQESDEIKLKKKKELIFKLVVNAYKLPLEHKRKYVKRMKGAFTSGNAFFMSYQRYDAQKDSLERVMNTQFNGDIKMYLNDLKTRYQSL